MGQRINMIGLFVSDLPRMVAFYHDVLGFEMIADPEGNLIEIGSWNKA